MFESIDTLKDRTIYWLKSHPGIKCRVGIIVEQAENCVTDAIATGFALGNDMLGDVVEELEG